MIASSGKAISSAFKAHARGEYELSIPVFLTQIDGICYEIAQFYFFLGSDKSKKQKYLDNMPSNSLVEAIISPVIGTSPINKSGVSDTYTKLNRHLVLHGKSVDYGTEINSLKVISLLYYIVCQLKTDK